MVPSNMRTSEIDITAVLSETGPTTIYFRVNEPLPYDGIRVPPVVYRGHGAVK